MAKALREQSLNCGDSVELDFVKLKMNWVEARNRGIPTSAKAQEIFNFFQSYITTPDQQVFVYRDFLSENYPLVSSKEFLKNHIWVMCIESPRYEASAALINSLNKSYFSEKQSAQISRKSFVWSKSPSLNSSALLLKLGVVVHLVNAEQVTVPSKTLARLEELRKELLKHSEDFSDEIKKYNKSNSLPSNFDAPEEKLRPYAELYFDELEYSHQKELELDKLYRTVLLK